MILHHFIKPIVCEQAIGIKLIHDFLECIHFAVQTGVLVAVQRVVLSPMATPAKELSDQRTNEVGETEKAITFVGTVVTVKLMAYQSSSREAVSDSAVEVIIVSSGRTRRKQTG